MSASFESVIEISIFDHPEFDNHEQLIYCRNEEVGLFAIIAIHNRNLGPAVGGCRMYPYASYGDGFTDVLRLSKGMTYKNAMADLPLGGGKSIIYGNPKTQKTPELLRSFSKFIQNLGGQYYSAEDIGIGVDDVKIMAEECEYIFGLPSTTGDPSPYTARGVLEGMRASINFKFNDGNFEGLKISIQGVGNVGMNLCKLLSEEGAELVVTDTDQSRLRYAYEMFNAKLVSPAEIYTQDVDIFAPCAIGGILNSRTIDKIKAPIIAGSANNQLNDPQDGISLHRKGILYVPDYVLNAGGVISISREILPNFTREMVLNKVNNIFNTCKQILSLSENTDTPTCKVADSIAESKFLKR